MCVVCEVVVLVGVVYGVWCVVVVWVLICLVVECVCVNEYFLVVMF